MENLYQKSLNLRKFHMILVEALFLNSACRLSKLSGQLSGKRLLSNFLFSMEWNNRYWRLDPCLNCRANVWNRDWVFTKQSRGRHRYSCFYCGTDVYPGGAINEALGGNILPEAPDVGALTNASEELNTTVGGKN